MNERTKLIAELAARIVAADLPGFSVRPNIEETASYAVLLARTIVELAEDAGP